MQVVLTIWLDGRAADAVENEAEDVVGEVEKGGLRGIATDLVLKWDPKVEEGVRLVAFHVPYS